MNLSDKIGELALISADHFGRFIGPSANVSLGRNLGSLVGYFTPRELKILTSQLKLAQRSEPSLSRLQPEELIRKVYGHIGESVAELSQLKYLLARDEADNSKIYPRYKNLEVIGVDPCREIVEKNEGAIILTGHVGNFELLAAYHIASGVPMTILGKDPNYEFLSRWIQKYRTKYGSESLLRGVEGESKRSSAIASIKALKEGKALGLLPDQDTALVSEFVPFFGVDAAYIVAPIKLAIKSQKKIYSSFIARVGPLKHKIWSEILPYDPSSDSPERDVLAEFSRRLQKAVVQYPEQYLWIHRRWRRRPGVDYDKNPEQLRGLKDYLSWLEGDPK